MISLSVLVLPFRSTLALSTCIEFSLVQAPRLLYTLIVHVCCRAANVPYLQGQRYTAVFAALAAYVCLNLTTCRFWFWDTRGLQAVKMPLHNNKNSHQRSQSTAPYAMLLDCAPWPHCCSFRRQDDLKV